MIQIIDKKDCCGCNACVQRCPKQCITMQADGEGFLYPVVDTALCIDCGLCEKVCPVINQSEPRKPQKVYAAYNKNEEIRLQSSSGGIFTLLAEETIKKGGVVFGVKFNEDWMPEFDYTETIEGITPFRGSKYVQAIVGNAYKEAEKFLKAGREVLFSGTPCQIAGLKRFLRKEYENLLAVDIICHGVPSPKIWDLYIKETCSKLLGNSAMNAISSTKCLMSEHYIESILFRSKTTGWKKYSFMLKLQVSNGNKDNGLVFTEPFVENSFMRAFLSDTILRPSCHDCPAKQGKSHSDITIADFWGIDKLDPLFDDDKGCCAIFLNTEKGKKCYPIGQTVSKEKAFNEAVAYNPSYNKNSQSHPKREKFFKRLEKATNLSQYILEMQKPTLKQKIVNNIKRYTKAIIRRLK